MIVVAFAVVKYLMLLLQNSQGFYYSILEMFGRTGGVIPEKKFQKYVEKFPKAIKEEFPVEFLIHFLV